MHYTTIVKAFAALTSFTLVLSSSLPAAREVRSIDNNQPGTFSGEIDGRAYEFSGTATEVLVKLKERHPELEKHEVEDRAVVNKNGLICYPVPGWNWEQADVGDIEQCIDALNHLDRFTIGAHSCAVICCEGGDTVTLCNDNGYSINPAGPYLASYAQDIINDCQNNGLVGGQEFDSDNYNIIVRGNNGLVTDCNFS